jgi:protein phosphatase 2C family protein 2/3
LILIKVTRTFGDIEAKLPIFEGNPNVVIATPEIKSFKIQDSHDFIILGSNKIFKKLLNVK